MYYCKNEEYRTPKTDKMTIASRKYKGKATTTTRRIDRPTKLALTQRSALDATSNSEYKADDQHLDLPAQIATTGIIGQHVAVQEHPLLTGQTQKTSTMRKQNTATVDHHDTGKWTVTMPEDLQLVPQKYTSFSLTLQTHLTEKITNGSHTG